jgi:DNA-binding NarL/FixJ family response regulator
MDNPSAVVLTLLIEDSPTSVEVMKRCLKKSSHAYLVKEAGTMAEARLALRNGCFDLVLLDLMLPNGEGLALVREVRALVPDKALVVVTGLTDKEIAIGALKAMADEYIVKGGESDEAVLLMLTKALARAAGRREFAGIGLQRVAERIDRTLKECETVESLPPFNAADASAAAAVDIIALAASKAKELVSVAAEAAEGMIRHSEMHAREVLKSAAVTAREMSKETTKQT